MLRILLILLSVQSFASEKLSDSNRYKAIETLAKGLYYIENLYVDPGKVNYNDMVERAMHGVVSKLDPTQW